MLKITKIEKILACSSFSSALSTFLDLENLGISDCAYMCELDKETLWNWVHEKSHPQLLKVVRFCILAHLDLQVSLHLLSLAGYSKKLHSAVGIVLFRVLNSNCNNLFTVQVIIDEELDRYEQATGKELFINLYTSYDYN